METPLKVRPIALCNSAYKVFTGMITVRLKNVMQKYVKIDQKGFIADRYILENVLEFKIWKENLKGEQSLVSLDFAKAYDKVDVGYMIHVLERMDFPDGLVLMIKSLYKNSFFKVITATGLTQKGLFGSGVKQGDPLSPFLFNLALEPLLEMCRQNLKGIEVEGVLKKVSAYADDICLYVNDVEDMGMARSAWKGIREHQGLN